MRLEMYKSSDHQEIIQFLMQITVKEFGHHDWVDYFAQMDFTPYEKDESLFIYVRDDKGEVIGTCGLLFDIKSPCAPSTSAAKLNSFYVRKDYRGNGIGKFLIYLVMLFAYGKEYKHIYLCTYETFDRALSLYKKAGFRQYRVEGDELWLMREM